jgi:hypothetical protein
MHYPLRFEPSGNRSVTKGNDMRSAPVPPSEYDGEHLSTDDALRAEGYAAGLDVWEQVSKAYSNYLGDDGLANAQLWSLREAIRAEYATEAAS